MVHKIEKKEKTITMEETTLPTTPEEIEAEEERKAKKEKEPESEPELEW